MYQNKLSFWDKDHLSKCVDLLIVGGGITGLSTAWRYHLLHPKAKIRVVDRYALTRVASTRNAGFSCFGSVTEIQDDIDSFGRDAALTLVERRWKGIQLIQASFEPSAIEYHQTGGFELLDGHSWKADSLNQTLEDLNQDLSGIVGKDTFSLHHDQPSFGFKPSCLIVENRHEGQLNPAAFVHQIQSKMPRHALEVLAGIHVNAVEAGDDRVQLSTDQGNMQAKAVVFATNGMTGPLSVIEDKILPARNLVMVSEETNLKFNGVFHAEKGYIYFRNIGKRLLIGGGRHFAKEEEFTSEFGINEKIESELLKYVEHTILPTGPKLKFEFLWSGIMGMPENKTPIIKKIKDRLYIAAGFGGMGVALGMQSGTEVANLISKEQ